MAQDGDLLSLLPDSSGPDYTLATFKSTRLINQHTTETVGKRTLDFRISHRFGPVNSGADDFWGLDGGASIRLALEYSYDGRLMAGFGRTSYQKMLDGFVKYKWLRQRDDGKMPINLTLLACMYYTTAKDPQEAATGVNRYEYTSSRMSYNFQAMISRKFSERLSLQVSPFLVHYNLVFDLEDKNDVYGIAACGRFKISKRVALTAEYSHCLNDYSAQTYYDSFGIGVDVETGGHVFQMHFTNSFGLVENQFFPSNNESWSDGGARLGFNISRVFTL